MKWRVVATLAAAFTTASVVALAAPTIAGAQTLRSHGPAAAAGSHSTASHATSAAPAVAATPATPTHSGLVIGDLYCGTASISPGTKVTGGTKLSVSVTWKGSPSTKHCVMPPTNCGSVYFGSCTAGYWIIGIFCNPLAAINIAKGQQYCDTNNIVVLTDNNAGPNNPSDSHGTSYNQCTTVNTLGSIFGGLPGTLYCAADGQNSDGWTDNWALGSVKGSASGPAEMTGSTTPFRPSAKGVDCPPSAANIKAGALPGYCAFTIMPVTFQYTCFGGCVPDPSLPNNGAAELTADHLAVLFQYATKKK